MLLLAISRANLRPSADTWTAVASLLGGGLSASAVRCAQRPLPSKHELDNTNTKAVRNTTSCAMNPTRN